MLHISRIFLMINGSCSETMSSEEKLGNYESLTREFEVARKELKNIRQELCKQRSMHEKDVKNIKQMLSDPVRRSCYCQNTKVSAMKKTTENIFNMHPVGYISSWFNSKNGTPRQPTVCPLTKAVLRIDKTVFSNPEHCLNGLEEFSYIWILFVFHENKDAQRFPKAKIHPPRLNGASVGVFSTRSPHRPNAIGLSLTKLEKIEGDSIFLSGVDLLNGTPVLDVKPFIPFYDMPWCSDNIQVASAVNNQSHTVMCKDGPSANGGINNFLRNKEACDLQPNDSDEIRVESDICADEECTNDYHSNKHVPDEFYETFHKSVEGVCHGQNESKSNYKFYNTSDYTLYEAEKVSTSDCAMTVPSKVVMSDSVKHLDVNHTANCNIAAWLRAPPVRGLNATLTTRAEEDLQKFHYNNHNDKCQFCFSFLLSTDEAKLTIIKLLQQDPRSTYRRKKCTDRLYFFCVDVMHVTCWFDDDSCLAEVLKIKPISN